VQLRPYAAAAGVGLHVDTTVCVFRSTPDFYGGFYNEEKLVTFVSPAETAELIQMPIRV